jgi:hypothetical protein
MPTLTPARDDDQDTREIPPEEVARALEEAHRWWESQLPEPWEVAERFRRAGRVDPFQD